MATLNSKQIKRITSTGFGQDAYLRVFDFDGNEYRISYDTLLSLVKDSDIDLDITQKKVFKHLEIK